MRVLGSYRNSIPPLPPFINPPLFFATCKTILLRLKYLQSQSVLFFPTARPLYSFTIIPHHLFLVSLSPGALFLITAPLLHIHTFFHINSPLKRVHSTLRKRKGIYILLFCQKQRYCQIEKSDRQFERLQMFFKVCYIHGIFNTIYFCNTVNLIYLCFCFYICLVKLMNKSFCLILRTKFSNQ